MRERGYAIVDDALDVAHARALREEMSTLRARGTFRANETLFVDASTSTTKALVKTGIEECEYHALRAEDASAAPRVGAFAQSWVTEGLNAAMGWGDDATRRLTRSMVKMQINQGRGACFPLHFDSDASIDSRRMTMLAYLNEGWTRGDGGELVIYPFPEKEIVVEPIAGRVVLLSSQFGLHRVLPSTASERYMFTVWFFAKDTPGSVAAPKPGPNAETQMAALLHPALRKHLCKLVLAETWARSIEEAHADDQARASALRTHWSEVEIIGRVLSKNYPLGLEKIALDVGDNKLFPPIEWF